MISLWVKRRELDRNTGIRVLDFYPHNPLVAGSSPAGPTFHLPCPPQRTNKTDIFKKNVYYTYGYASFVQ